MDAKPSQQPTDLIAQLLTSAGPEWLLAVLDTREAAAFMAVPEDTLVTLRSRGGGPRFVRPGGGRAVRYLRVDLLNWLLARGRMTNTADSSRPGDLSALLGGRPDGQ